MTKSLLKSLAIMLLALTGTGVSKAANYAWPANWEGVMLQGFYWDSYTDTKWSNLEAQADELSSYFKLIWVPNSGYSGGHNNMGYTPIYWFTNHNSSFGTEAQLRSMIKTFKDKGTGIIADVVVNHRNGKSNWTDFPVEQWNGQTWQIGPEGICRTDEVSRASGQATPTGANDTGEDFDGARDLDHTNANVQNNVKNYCKCLLEDYGYTGFRLDMVKGYSGYYTKIYNEYAHPTFCVGEYWDGNYDKVKEWIEATGKQSAAFDFPGKYAINEAFATNDMTKLVWKANGTTPQPAGMIHFGYSQYAVTFVDNHDTYRDGSKFTSSKVVAANAFILCSPGTPCVFLPHYKANKAAIQTLINVRNSVGLHNNSAVNVLQSNSSCYMAEVTGSKGKLVVKIGDAMVSPSGYSDSDIVASGDGYCVWTKVSVSGGNSGGGSITPPQGGGSETGTAPASLYVLGNIEGANWTPSKGVAMTKDGQKFVGKSITLTPDKGETNCYFNLASALGADWDELNGAGNRYGAPAKNTPLSVGGSATMMEYVVDVNNSACESWEVPAGTYDITADFSVMKVYLAQAGQGGTQGGGSGEIEDPNPTEPTTDCVTIYFDNSSSQWASPHIHYWGATESSWPGVAMSKYKDNIYRYDCPAGTTGCLFNAGDGDATKTQDFTAIHNHLYSRSKDWGVYEDAAQGGNQGGNQGGQTGGDVTMPSALYILGNMPGNHWSPANGLPMTKEGNTFVAKKVTLEAADPTEDPDCYFTFVTALGADWDAVNCNGNRYGAPAMNTPVAVGGSAPMMEYVVDVNNSSAQSWQVPAGTYDITADFETMQVHVAANDTEALEAIDATEQGAPVYFNMQGIRVLTPQPGVPYIVVRGGKASKLIVR